MHQHAGHAHDHGARTVVAPTPPGTMLGALVLTLCFVVGEAVAGWLGHSLALLSDAGHNLTDAAALGLSWYAMRMAARPSHHGMTFGYHRIGVMAAFVNAVSLVVIALAIAWEAA